MWSERNDVILHFAAGFKGLHGHMGEGVGGCLIWDLVRLCFMAGYPLFAVPSFLPYLTSIFGKFLRCLRDPSVRKRSRAKSVEIAIYSAQLGRIKVCILKRCVWSPLDKILNFHFGALSCCTFQDNCSKMFLMPFQKKTSMILYEIKE